MQNAIVPSSLDVSNTKYAEEQYGDFVDVHGPILTISEFQKRRNLPLNEQCSSVFYSKTAHLTDIDFVEIDRPILEMIGFKNTVYEVKDKNGTIKLDKNGNPKLKDMRSDFSSAIRCLRNTVGFIEGSSVDDVNAHFVVQKAGKPGYFPENSGHGGAGLNKQSLWIRMRALEHFVIMANTCNSFIIREYFLDLKRIMMEYNMYQTVYRAKYELCMKDSVIGELRSDMHTLMEKSRNDIHVLMEKSQRDINVLMEKSQQDIHALMEKSDIQTQKLEMMSDLLMKETDNKVIDVEARKKKQELVVLRSRNEPTQIEVLRGQTTHVNQQLKRKKLNMEVVGKIDTYKNPINLLNRFDESIKKEGDERFHKTNNKIVLKNGSTAEDLMHVFHDLEEDKHVVAKKAKQCL